MIYSTNEEEMFDYTEIIPRHADEAEITGWALHRLMQLFTDERFQDGASMRDVRLLFLAAKPFTAAHFDAAIANGQTVGMFKVTTVPNPHKPGRDKKVFQAGSTLQNLKRHAVAQRTVMRSAAFSVAQTESEAYKKALKH